MDSARTKVILTMMVSGLTISLKEAAFSKLAMKSTSLDS